MNDVIIKIIPLGFDLFISDATIRLLFAHKQYLDIHFVDQTHFALYYYNKKQYRVTRRRSVLDYVGSPISVRNLETGLIIDGKIISIIETEKISEIVFSANGMKFTIVRDHRSGDWYEKSDGKRYKI